MNTIKLFSAVVVMVAVSLNSLKVASASSGSSRNVPSPGSDSNPSIGSSVNVPSFNSRTSTSGTGTETDEADCVPVPTSILLKLVVGNALSDADRARLCSILRRFAGGIIHRLGNEESHARMATPTADQVVPQRCESVESRTGEHSRSTRINCPADSEAQSNPRSTGYYVQPNQTRDGLEVMDTNHQYVGTINACEPGGTVRNPTTRNTDN